MLHSGQFARAGYLPNLVVDSKDIITKLVKDFILKPKRRLAKICKIFLRNFALFPSFHLLDVALDIIVQ